MQFVKIVASKILVVNKKIPRKNGGFFVLFLEGLIHSLQGGVLSKCYFAAPIL